MDYPSVGVVNRVCQQYIKEPILVLSASKLLESKGVAVLYADALSIHAVRQPSTVVQGYFDVCMPFVQIAVVRCLHESLALEGKRRDV